ncbi:DUF4846 domain-containing protein [Terrimonas sp. NA20]|uniref:DUF4846 domain-containing protein n=1 Tax=Terrimonas ginsenosidimutans TaxID=2908004 RepID=A0ABS9KUP2_9BACT|nr:DUF4846 domain-containing protein [Terrimonas ginsenosidimutans]MCG2616000.1 DUF4846 domain-containing protein [Terrimonas ginsenosidimutans]
MGSNFLKPLLLGLALTQCSDTDMLNVYPNTGQIPLPAGFTRTAASPDSFAQWLRDVKLKPDNTVYLYNGNRKRNQDAQFAVMDISVGKKDLQQCADAVIRLYAEYQYSKQQYDRISFNATDGTTIDYESWKEGYRFPLRQHRLQKVKTAEASNSRKSFDQYLEVVFSYAGTLSLSRDLQRVNDINDIKPGDVFVEGGSPGHAVTVTDVARSANGKKIFMLAQSYMPAQDIHILKNPENGSAWYSTEFGSRLHTPEWVFKHNSLYRWK